MNIDFYDDSFTDRDYLKNTLINWFSELPPDKRSHLLERILSTETRSDSLPAITEIIFENHPLKNNYTRSFHFKSRIYIVNIYTITRVLHSKRKAFFYCHKLKEFEILCSLKEMEETLCEYPDIFIRINNIEYINIMYISEINGQAVKLKTGELCSISRSYISPVRKKLSEFNFIRYNKKNNT